MELLVRVRWRHVPAADLVVDVEPYHTVGDVVATASEFCEAQWDTSQPVYLERTTAELPLDSPILDSDMLSGDTLRFELYGVEPVQSIGHDEAVSCDVTAGPEAGRSFVLVPGFHQVGRGAQNQVNLDDRTVSSRHVTIEVTAELTTRVTPEPGLLNPLVVNGRIVSETTDVGPNDVVQFGATAIALRVFSRSSDAERDQLGQVPFRRTPYKPVIVTEREFKPLARIPTKPEPRRFSPVPAIAPVVMGLGMYAITRMPYMLMMMAMSPVMMVSNFFDNRKSGRQKFADQVAQLRERVEKRKAEIAQALLDERAERISQSPDLADLARRATLRTLDLWSRQRGDEEFLRTRLGIGTVHSKVTVEPDTAGEDYLRDAVEAHLAGSDRLPASPICINLADLGVFGLHGEYADVRAMCSSVLLQAATLHSPEDLVIVVLEGFDQGIGTWAKWLPHTRSTTSPLGGNHVVHDQADAAEMVRQLVSIARMRTGTDDRADHRWPWVLVVLDESADVDPALTSQLLELCPAAGMSVVAAVESDARVPRQAKATFRCVPPHRGALSSVWFTEPQAPSEQFEPEPANARLIDRVAMSLAPLRDATSASATAAIPRVVPLLSLFGPEPPTPLTVNATWTAPKPYGLRAPIGMGPSGPLELDLVEHGPHALIGGTSGAGKSELLQSIVASLIHEYPPTRLTFLFVDYKGGAATEVFGVVPHTVGYVTNLDASLSLRALTSLRAELNHRMRMMEGKAKDLAEMLEKYPDEAPPSLVIVVDEFATLVKEVPDFVAGVVDIAQRGRSLGVHLILATQRPSGSVNDNILANTNLRISLRMLDASESNTVIGVGSAADIPLPLKGRGFAKLGPSDLIEFQSAYTGAELTQEEEVSPVEVRRFGNVPRPGGASMTAGGRRRTSGSTRQLEPSARLTGQGYPFDSVPVDVIPDAPVRAQPIGQTYQGVPLRTPAAASATAAPATALPPPTVPHANDGAAETTAPNALPPPSVPATDENGEQQRASSAPAPLAPINPAVANGPSGVATTTTGAAGGGGGSDEGPTTHLDSLVDAITTVAPGWPVPRKPWREMLPDELDWTSIDPPEYATGRSGRGRYVTLGLVDDPAAQAQFPAVFDLEETGGLLIGGAGGSGKTTALRTAALSAIAGATPDEVTLFVLDCGSRALAALRALPHVAAVATGDDLESITRLITLLSAEVDRRRPILAALDVQAENLTAYLDKGYSMPRIVILIDGFQNLSAVIGNVKAMEFGPLDWFVELQRVITDGRQLGIHAVLTTDRRPAVPALLMSALGARLVLRQTDETGYMDYGIPSAISKGIELPAGRGLWDNQLVQIGLVSSDPSGAGQGAAIAAAAEARPAGLSVPPELATSLPPEELRVPLTASDPDSFTLGRTDVFGDLVEVSVRHTGLCVTGPPRSGRTTALRHAARSLIAAGFDVWTIGLIDDPDAEAEGLGGSGHHASAKLDPAQQLLEDFAAQCESLPSKRPYILVVDDVDRYDDATAFSNAYERVLKTETCRLIGSLEVRNMSGYTQCSMINEIRREPTVLFLQPDSSSDVQGYTGVKPQLRPGHKLGSGRGVLIVNRQPSIVQVANGIEG